MPELKERLAEVDRVEFPKELWSAALRRAAAEGVQEPVTRSPFRPVGRVAVATVAFAVFIAAAFFLWNAFESRSQRPRPGETTPALNPLSQLPAGWNNLPDPPDVRTGSATVWTGSKLLVWGGYVYTGFSDEEPLEDGYSLDPLTGSAETLSHPPLAARAFPAMAWTGSELIVWGGWDLQNGFFDDGAAYDPASGEWRALPKAPIEARMAFSLWTGSELLVWGSRSRDTRLVDGAAYDPADDSWRQIADAPLELTDGTAVWTGKEMIVFGAALHGGNQPESPAAIGAAYDPATDSWRLLADSQLSPQASTAAWNGERMVAWDYLNQSQTYDPDRDEWGPVEHVPLEDYECSPQSASVSGSIIGDYCGATVIYDDGVWSDISRPDYLGWGFELVAADPAVLFFGSNLDTGANALLAYRVQSDVGSTIGPLGLPPVTLTPDHGPVGTSVRIEGDGFTDPFWQEVARNGRGYGVFLIGNGPGDCELITQGRYALDISSNGHLVADFTIPGDGSCFQTDRIELIRPGRYSIGIGCHACQVAAFDVEPSEGTAASPASGALWRACPTLAGTAPISMSDSTDASSAAERFLRGPNADAYLDTAGRENGLRAGTGTEANVVLSADIASGAWRGLVANACGEDTADRTFAVVIDDGTDSASLDFTLFLIHRVDGWKVWANY